MAFSTELEQERIQSILEGTSTQFEINNNPNADPLWHEGLAIESMGITAVELFGDRIEAEAAAQGINPDWLKSIMYLENSQGAIWDFGAYNVPGAPLPSSLMPMNINPSIWGGIGGYLSADDFVRAVQVHNYGTNGHWKAAAVVLEQVLGDPSSVFDPNSVTGPQQLESFINSRWSTEGGSYMGTPLAVNTFTEIPGVQEHSLFGYAKELGQSLIDFLQIHGADLNGWEFKDAGSGSSQFRL